MTPDGYDKICEALQANESIEAFSVIPKPEPGENIQELTINATCDGPEEIYRALGTASLLNPTAKPSVDSSIPSLVPLSQTQTGNRQGRFRFSDTSAK